MFCTCTGMYQQSWQVISNAMFLYATSRDTSNEDHKFPDSLYTFFERLNKGQKPSPIILVAQKWNLHPMWPSPPPPLGKNNAVFPLPPTPSLLVSSFQSFGHLWNHQYYCHWTYCFLPFYWPRAHLVTCK